MIDFRRHIIIRNPGKTKISEAFEICHRLGNLISHYSVMDVDRIIAWSTERPVNCGNLQVDDAIFWHRLSPFTQYRDKRLQIRHSSSEELRILESIPQNTITTMFQTRESLERFASHLHMQFEPTSGGLRQGDVGSVSQITSTGMLYPDAKNIGEGLSEICETAASLLNKNPLFAAIAIWIMFTTIHPFSDGNGRVARVIFNMIIRANVNKIAFIPLYELWAISKGGLLLAVREAEYEDNWDCVSTMILKACSELGTITSTAHRGVVQYGRK